MLSKILPGVLFLFFVIWPLSAQAANEFSTSYKVTYTVNPDSPTQVKEEIKLKNLTEKFFPSSFSVILPGKEVANAQASDSQGLLEVVSSPEGENTKLTVKFSNQQIIGLNKEYLFNLSFEDKNIAKNLGKIWMVNIPKVTQGTQIDSSSFVLSVPTSFGDPDYISPLPLRIDESGGRINFLFDEKILSKSGISVVFGRELGFAFENVYQLKNDSIFPKFFKFALPADSSIQKTFIDNIEPLPDNTQTDGYGNTFAIFKLNSAQVLEVKVAGFVRTFLQAQERDILNESDKKLYLTDTKYWDPNNPAIKNKLSEILVLNNPTTSFKIAREIDKFVSNFLKFNPERLNGDFERFGSVTALNNPNQALASEFVDLEIALLRSAGIPARQAIGFSLIQDSRPFSFTNQKLHTWVEFYDPEKGWVISDPTWEHTTRGADYFAFNDLVHIKLLNYNGDENSVLPYDLKVGIFNGEINSRRGAELDVKVNPEILSGFPARAKIRINNLGNSSFPASELRMDTAKVLLETENDRASVTRFIKTPVIPPFGNLEYDVNLKTGAIWHSYQDVLQVTFAGVTDTQVLSVVPILSRKIFAIEIIGGVIIIALFYTLILMVHHKSVRRPS